MSKLQAVYLRMQAWCAEIIAGDDRLTELLTPFLQTGNVIVFLIVFKTQQKVQPLIEAMKNVDEDAQDNVADSMVIEMLTEHDIVGFDKHKLRMRKYLKLFAYECIN
jgi:hypothetical protein